MKVAIVSLVLGSVLAWGAWATTELIDRPTKKDLGMYLELIADRLGRLEDKVDRLIEQGK